MFKPQSLTREQIREIDRIALEEYGMPGVVLMENAGRNAAEIIQRTALPDPHRGSVAIVCGSGNNGGDGFVIARHLSNAGIDVTLYMTCEPAHLTGDAAINYYVIEKMGLPYSLLRHEPTIAAARNRWRNSDVLVDALLGTGFTGEVRQPIANVIAALNATPSKPTQTPGRKPILVAIDLPSGLDANTGTPSNATIKADLTITMAAKKIGFDAPGSEEWTGSVVVVNIGIPDAIFKRVQS